MGWATSRWIFIALAGLSLSGCQMFQGIFGGGRPDTQPPAADESGEWRQIATSADRDRLRRLRAAWTHALQQVRAAGHGPELDALGPLADPDVALLDPLPSPGSYACRTIKIGAKSPGMLDYIAYPPFHCAVTAEPGGRLGLAKLTGSQRQKGMMWADAPRRGVFLGTIERSEEHTSELQSLMRISYAVFCLQKK